MKNKIKITLIIFVILALSFLIGCKKSQDNTDQITSQTGTYNINIEDFAFSPSELRIKKGDTITWTNKDNVKHTVTSDSGSELNSKLLSKNQQYFHTFNQIGAYNYHCTPHPNMKASIIVE